MRVLVVTPGVALLFAWSPMLPAQPRLLADAEMDQVCAKGSAGFNVELGALNEMVFEFYCQTALGPVIGNGVMSVEVIPNSSEKSSILMRPAITVPGGAPTAAVSTLLGAPAASSAGVAPLDAVAIPATDFQVVNGTVRVRGDVNVNMQTFPSVLRALQQNRLVLPPGFNPLAGTMQPIGAVR